jgi:hypothetical protein
MVEPEIIELIKKLESPYNENSRIGERDQDLKDAVLYLLYLEQTRQMLAIDDRLTTKTSE